MDKDSQAHSATWPGPCLGKLCVFHLLFFWTPCSPSTTLCPVPFTCLLIALVLEQCVEGGGAWAPRLLGYWRTMAVSLLGGQTGTPALN